MLRGQDLRMGGGAYPSPQKIFEFFSLEMNTFIWTKQHKKEEKEQDEKQRYTAYIHQRDKPNQQPTMA